MQPRGIMETCLYADNLDAAEAFYRDIFGLQIVTRAEGRHVFFRCGPGMLLIFDPRATRAPAEASPIPPHGATGPGHVCFRIAGAEELPHWQAHFKAHGIAIEAVHDWPTGARSLYIRDPAGNSVEIGEPRMWGLD